MHPILLAEIKGGTAKFGPPCKPQFRRHVFVVRVVIIAKNLQMHCQWKPLEDVIIYNLRTDSPRIFKLGGGVEKKVKVTRSRNVSAARML